MHQSRADHSIAMKYFPSPWLKSCVWQCVSLASVFLLPSTTLWAIDEVQPRVKSELEVNNFEAPKPDIWRSFSHSYGAAHYQYLETDPYGRVYPLDSETGSIPVIQATLRWRGKPAPPLPDIIVQAEARYAHGQTDYNGYLQTGINLTPYSSRTSNTLRSYNLRVGLPLGAFTQLPWGQNVAPYVAQSWHHWERNLTQYGEYFTWQATSIGVMALCPLADFDLPQLSRFTLEADWSAGRTRNPHIVAPALRFAADLGSENTSIVALALHYAATPTWLFGLRYEAQHMSFGASPTMAGLQYPNSSSLVQSLTVSLDYYFQLIYSPRIGE